MRVNSWAKCVLISGLNTWAKKFFRFVITISFLSPYIDVEGNEIISALKKNI